MPDNPANTRIKKLSPLLINQLAAGEVVTRPAAVVKELLENAIDAGATNIEVNITQGGMGMIEVVDNGVGIHPDDMVMAITRHATSKVADVANLHGITTLGFRGEALAATAAVSRLTLTSSHDGSGVGRQLQVAGVLSDTPKLNPVVHHHGTTITVKDLYFNVPARRGNLKSIATEFGHIETIVRDVALARADVALTLFHDNKKRLSLSLNGLNDKNNLLLSRLEQATGSALTEQAIEVVVDLSSLIQPATTTFYNNHSNSEQAVKPAQISGWLWPNNNAQQVALKLIYVNGRLVKELLISNQLRQIAQSAQLASLGYALYFELPTDWLNINVHPSKQRIKINSLNNIMAHLSHALQTKLKAFHVKKTIYQRDKTRPNNHISTADSMNSPANPYSYQGSMIAQRQVQAPIQAYQVSANSSMPQEKPQSSVAASLDKRDNGFGVDIGFNADSASDANTGFVRGMAQIQSFPHCLEVFTNEKLANYVSLDLLTANGLDESTSPWLLFYYKEQCLLIAAKTWRTKLTVLLETQPWRDEFYKKVTIANDADSINQYLTAVGSQMSPQDLSIFLQEVTALLSEHAIKRLDSSQLVASMLSSAIQ